MVENQKPWYKQGLVTSNAFANVGLWLAIASYFLWGFWVIPLLAVICSALGIWTAKRSGGHGKAQAIFGLVFGCIFMSLAWRAGLAPHPIQQQRAAAAPPAARPQVSSGLDAWDAMPYESKKRLDEIIVGTLKDPTFLTPTIHQEFWQIVQRGVGQGVSREQLEQAMRPWREKMTDVVLVYQKLIWEDARTALVTGRPAKSVSREKWEKRALAQGVVTEWRVRENEKFIENVANHTPVASRMITDVVVKQALSGLEERAARVDQLLTPPLGALTTGKPKP